jgi:hypothetical protein
MTSRSKPAIAEDIDQRWNWLFKLGGMAALLLLALFLIRTTRIITVVHNQIPQSAGYVVTKQLANCALRSECRV